MKIPFDIRYKSQIESGEYKVETGDGYPARIICWDSPIDKDRPIISIVYDNQIEQYKADGRYDNDYETSSYDLFITTPEPELTEFEKALETFLMNADSSTDTFHEETKKYASKLLDLARKEIMGEAAYDAYPLNESNRFNHEYNAKRVGFYQGYEQAEKETIERAINVLYEQIDDLIYSHLTIEDFLEKFRKTMEK